MTCPLLQTCISTMHVHVPLARCREHVIIFRKGGPPLISTYTAKDGLFKSPSGFQEEPNGALVCPCCTRVMPPQQDVPGHA